MPCAANAFATSDCMLLSIYSASSVVTRAKVFLALCCAFLDFPDDILCPGFPPDYRFKPPSSVINPNWRNPIELYCLHPNSGHVPTSPRSNENRFPTSCFRGVPDVNFFWMYFDSYLIRLAILSFALLRSWSFSTSASSAISALCVRLQKAE